jgi:uncharacterized phage protein gp47/JayE
MTETREVIQERMLSNISNEYDKTEGSFFYDVIKPVAIELENKYKKDEEISSKLSIENLEGDELTQRVKELTGIERKLATYATTTVIVNGSEGALINVGDKIASETVNFIFQENKTIDSSGRATVLVKCEEAGSIGNVPVGAIKYFPITIPGLVSVTNPNAVTNGYDEETDESLRQRYYERIRTPATSGNKYHYKNWAKEVTGVGDAKVFPLWNGNGTVKVAIINSNKRAADTSLVNLVANHIEENRPIGANVTVVSATEKPINISATLVIDTKKYTLNQVQADIESNLVEYFKEIAFTSNYISYASIGNIIFNTEGVIDYTELLINGASLNILLQDEEVPILGTVSLGV